MLLKIVLFLLSNVVESLISVRREACGLIIYQNVATSRSAGRYVSDGMQAWEVTSSVVHLDNKSR